MPYTLITKPTQGDTTKKSLADALIDNDAFFNALLSALGSVNVPNGSFELDSDADGIPDAWAQTLFTGGAAVLSSDQSHGQYSYRFTSPGGASNGGGYLESEDFFEVSPNVPLILQWQMKSSVAGVRNTVEIKFYNVLQSLVSTTTLYDDSTTNPTSWTLKTGAAIPPSGTRYAKIRLTGCHNSDATAGATYFDDVSIRPIFLERTFSFDAVGKGDWVCPAGVYGVHVEVFGAGGGGGAHAGNGGGGGGGGAYARKLLAVTPGTAYTVIVGAKGTGGITSGAAATAGGGSQFSTITAGGGGAGGQGVGSPGTAGTAGVAAGGDDNVDGIAGAAGNAGGYGGYSPVVGARANTDNADVVAAFGPAGGGAGAAVLANGGAGYDGLIILRY